MFAERKEPVTTVGSQAHRHPERGIRRGRWRGRLAALMLSLGLIGGAEAEGVVARAELGKPEPFSFEQVIALAEALAAEPAAPAADRHSKFVEELDAGAITGVRMRDNARLWDDSDSPFAVRGMHRGHHQPGLVELYEVHDGEARPWSYRKSAFGYQDPALARTAPADLGFGGFEVELKPPERDDETNADSSWLVFSGGAYFGVPGKDGEFGVSARAVSVDAGLNGQERFPSFTRFWLQRPEPGDTQLHIHALLEGEALTGAWHFIWHHDENGSVIAEVDARIFIREDIALLGIAPLDSMFWYGENDRRTATDWRPEVHDSDGLKLITGSGEQIWRPLVNPPYPAASRFIDSNPGGFGLMQRDREFTHYQDVERRYHLRPDLWIEPLDDWGQGAVHLRESPTDSTRYDNILAFWNPREQANAGSRWQFRYRMHWGTPVADTTGLARVMATRLGRSGYAGAPREDASTRFVIDFDAGEQSRGQPPYELKAILNASRGEVGALEVSRVIGTPIWRVMFDLEAGGREPIDLRLYLSHEDERVSETWLYRFHPRSVPWIEH